MDRKRGHTDEPTPTDPSGESAKCPRSSQGKSLAKSEELDQKPVDEKDFKTLHSAIEKGELDTVKGIVDDRAKKQEEIKEALYSCDEHGRNLLNSLFRWNTSERIIETLNLIKKYLDDEDLFKEFLKSKNKYSSNIFHLTTENRNVYFGEILTFCEEHLEKEDMKEMLIGLDKHGRNLLHSSFKWNTSERIIEILNLIKKYLDDEDFFIESLKSKDIYSMNIFHFTAENINEVNTSFLKSFLSKSEIKQLLIESDKYDRTLLHCRAYKYPNKLLTLLHYSLETLEDDQLQLKKLILAKNRFKNTFLQEVVKSDNFNYKEQIVIEIIESLKEKVPDKLFKKLLRSRNIWRETFLQIKWRRNNEELIKETAKVLEKDFIAQLL